MLYSRNFIGALLATAAVLGGGSVSAASISLNGTLRDFCSAGAAAVADCSNHADFPNDGVGNVADAVKTTLGPDGKPVFNSPVSSLFSNATNFDQWYRDTAGVNKTIATSLTFNDIGGGKYEFLDSDYFPLDGQGWGNQGLGHNYHFTLELHTTFTYQAGQKFDFTGDDDVWVFINGSRVIDLGGIHGAQSASVLLDTLGLTAGQNYAFDFFFAERHTSESNLRIQTSIAFDPNPVPEPGSLALVATALGIAGASLRRRRR